MSMLYCSDNQGGLREVPGRLQESGDPMKAFSHQMFALSSRSESLLIALHLKVVPTLKNAVAPGARHRQKSPAGDLALFPGARRQPAQEAIDQREVVCRQKHSLRASAKGPGQSPHR